MNNLRRLLDLPILVILMGVCCVSMALPAAYAVALGQFQVARAFFYSGCVLLVLTAMIGIATATFRKSPSAQSILMACVGAYFILPILLAVPLHQAIPTISFHAAWFEMLSSFTATGASVFDTPLNVADPIHFWRALVGWFGGYFALLVVMTVLAPLGLGGVELFGGGAAGKAGTAGHAAGLVDPKQRLLHFASLLLPIYAAITLVLWVALLMAGDTALVGLCHAMGTLSASGISPIGGLGAATSGPVGEALIFICMTFAVTRRLWPVSGMTDTSTKLWRDPELGLALGIVTIVSLILLIDQTKPLADSGSLSVASAVLRNIWAGAFTSLSFMTTTGFQSVAWPDLGAPGLFLLGLAMIGGGVATTAGGIKLLRVYALLRHGERELERIVHPHSIGGHGPVARRLRRQGAYLAWIFFMVFGLSIAGITAALTLTGMDFQSAFVLGIACLTTTGQLAAVVGDTPIGYANLGAGPMAILGIAMILGRLEILAVVVLLVPKGWSRQA